MTIVNFTPLASLAGGVLIGLAATGMLLLNGRITGISGIFCQAMREREGRAWRALFLLGLVTAGGIYRWWAADQFSVTVDASTGILIMAGLLVGFGTRLGGGCTSGHGICGLARLSKRSIAATMTFMLFGMITVWIMRHGWGY